MQSHIFKTAITLLALIAIPIIDFWWHSGAITGFTLLMSLGVCFMTYLRLIAWRSRKREEAERQNALGRRARFHIA